MIDEEARPRIIGDVGGPAQSRRRLRLHRIDGDRKTISNNDEHHGNEVDAALGVDRTEHAEVGLDEAGDTGRTIQTHIENLLGYR